MMASDVDQPSPPATAIVAGLLRLIAAGLEPVMVDPYRPDGLINVSTASGWWLLLQLDSQAEPVELTHAQAPSMLVPPWTYGCQRDDWTLGHDSRVITPVELLTVEQRQDLRQRLEAAPVRWQFRPPPFWDVSNLWDELTLD